MFQKRHSYCLSPFGLLSQNTVDQEAYFSQFWTLGSPRSWRQQILLEDFWFIGGRPIAVFSYGGRPQLLIPSHRGFR